MSRSICVYLSDATLAALKRAAAERNRSTSFILDELVRTTLPVAAPPALVQPVGNEQVPT